MQRLIRYFNKHDDELAGELILPAHVTLNQLRELITADTEDPEMVACYRISHGEVDFFKPYFYHEFQLDEFEYFLEVDA